MRLDIIYQKKEKKKKETVKTHKHMGAKQYATK